MSELTEIPYYCMSCKTSFGATKKKEIEPWSKYVSFEVRVPDQEASHKTSPTRMGLRLLLKH
jgi:hypothetical protein